MSGVVEGRIHYPQPSLPPRSASKRRRGEGKEQTNGGSEPTLPPPPCKRKRGKIQGVAPPPPLKVRKGKLAQVARKRLMRFPLILLPASFLPPAVAGGEEGTHTRKASEQKGALPTAGEGGSPFSGPRTVRVVLVLVRGGPVR